MILKMDDNKVLEDVFTTIESNTKKPEKFLSVQDNISTKFQEKLKDIYDFNYRELNKKSNALPELVIQGFDDEQIWQQLEIKNDAELTNLLGAVSRVLAGDNKLELPVSLTDPKDVQSTIDNENDDGDEDDDDDNYDNDDNDDDKSDGDEIKDEESDINFSDSDNSVDLDRSLKKNKNKVSSMKKKNKPSIVDDKFFKLDELDNFLNKEDKKEMNENNDDADDDDDDDDDESDDEEIDLFDNNLSSEEDEDPENARMIKYDGFFDSPESGDDDDNNKTSKNKKQSLEFDDNNEIETNNRKRKISETKLPEKRVKFNLIDNSDDDNDKSENNNNDDNDNNIKSSFENRQERLKQRIEKFEKEAISEKPWQLKGEITGSKRPEDSLLEEFVEVDIATRPAPIITEQTSLKLEDIIKQRIKDKAWDSVVRKYKPVETPKEYKKKLVMDQKKSQKSLAQIYEDEFVKQKAELNPDKDEHEEEEPKEHKEIRELMHSLFRKLDALSNFHYTPKLAQPEIKIISNIPAINMEEVAPVATTDATLLAPEEVMKKPRGDIIGKTERTKTDMNRARRKKKVMQKAKQQAIEKKQELMKDGPIRNKKQAKVIQTAMVKKLTKDRNISTIDESTDKLPKSSTAFFTQLQNEVSSSIKSKSDEQIKKKNKSVHSAKKLKL